MWMNQQNQQLPDGSRLCHREWDRLIHPPVLEVFDELETMQSYVRTSASWEMEFGSTEEVRRGGA